MAAHIPLLICNAERYLDAEAGQHQVPYQAQAQQNLLACLASAAASVERKGGQMGPTASRPSAGLQRGVGYPLSSKAADHQLQ